ncbi:arabinose efflux permease family protein [Desulfosporosinus orientis DSM 765]|uniref:Arabinose efflux permease family protein n=1 Tax=Desulfosporosinus orientis (strain ATCC 19365 / DSM 765 / NCIMB 8382 / VKM B-1628 / Singapore I) TaxID=768706 RepID=G7W7K1_DESOD|nr:MFS transporter [Desulfosporosinus orientis]AET65920.1 arabinose efflux permease family protein [Desulfosporosinus orientis DSM 765]
MKLKPLGIPRPVIILTVGAFIQSTGHSLMWPLNSLFMHNILNRTLTEAGTLLALQSAVTLLGQVLSGHLADRYGARKILLLGLISAVLSIGAIAVNPVWKVYAPAFIFFGLAQAFIFVPLYSLLNVVWPEGGRRSFNLLYVSNNAGVAIGTAIGGMVAQISFQLIFSLNTLTFFIFLILVFTGISVPRTGLANAAPKQRTKGIAKDPSFKVLMPLACGIFLVWVAYVQLVTILPVVMDQLGFSLFSYSILWSLNGIFIVTLQPFLTWLIQIWAHSFKRQFYLGSLLMSLGFGILLCKLPYPSYMLAMLVITLGEMLVLPAVPAAAAQISPQGKSGTYQGIVSGATSGGRMMGPLLGGIIFDFGGGLSVWILSIAFLGISLISFSRYGKASQYFLLQQNPTSVNT